MKTILIFDCWLPGFTYIKELAEEPGVKVIFVHTSSLQLGPPAREYKAFRAQLDTPEWVYDFSDFDYDFDTLLSRVKPDALLVMSLHHLEARTALLFASLRGIPTHFIPHGIFLVGDRENKTEKHSRALQKISKYIFKLPRVVYYSKFFWKYHAQMINRGLIRIDFKHTFKVYIELLTRYFHWQWLPSSLVQNYYKNSIGHLILYDSTIADYYRSNYGEIVAEANFIDSGTLDMTRIIRQIRRDPTMLTKQVSGKYAYLISSPYPDFFTGPNKTVYADIVRKLRIMVQSCGFDGLMYRPHPGEPAEFVKQICIAAGTEVDPKKDFSNLVNAAAVCGTSSTLLYCAVLLKKPIIIWDSKRLKVDPPYYEPLRSYPTIPFNADVEFDREALSAVRSVRETGNDIDFAELGDPIADMLEVVAALKCAPEI